VTPAVAHVDEPFTPEEARLLQALLGDGAGGLTDTAGRPVGEQADPRYDPAVDDAVCPFHDRRREAGLPINAGAMAQVRRQWPAVLGGMSAAASASSTPGPPTLRDAWAASHLAAAAALHAGLCVGAGPVDERLAALHKVGIGYTQALTMLAVFAPRLCEPDVPLLEAVPPEVFFEWLDQRALLVGQRQVCAGPRPMIEAGFIALAGGGDDDAASSLKPLLDRADVIRFADEVRAMHTLVLCAASEVRWRKAQGDTQAGEGFEGVLKLQRLRMARLADGWTRPARAAEVAAIYATGELPASIERLLTLGEAAGCDDLHAAVVTGLRGHLASADERLHLAADAQ
jgi:hypothetical protein